VTEYRAWPGDDVAGSQAGGARYTLLDGAALGLPVLIWVEASIIGRLFLVELALLALLPLLLRLRGRLLTARLPMTFIMLALLWLAFQVLTDIVRATAFADYARGWAKIGFTLTNFMALYLLLAGQPRRLKLFTIDLVGGLMLTAAVGPAEALRGDPWKFGYGLPVILAVAVLADSAAMRRTWLAPAALVIAIGGVSFVMGSRSLAGITIFAGVYVFYLQFVARRGASSAPSPTRTALALVIGVAGIWGIMQFYGYGVSQGYFGREAQAKLQRQTGQFGVLLGGRSEIYVSLQAIGDSPFLGHGSWPKNPKYRNILLELRRFGYDISTVGQYGDLIPTHSHLTGAWVEAGVFGAVIWFWVLYLDARLLATAASQRLRMPATTLFLGLLLFWDVLFSPFGAERRILVPYMIVMLMAALQSSGRGAEAPTAARVGPRQAMPYRTE